MSELRKSDKPKLIDIEAGLKVSQLVTESGDLKLIQVDVYEYRADMPTGPIAEFGSLADAIMFVWVKTNLEHALLELKWRREWMGKAGLALKSEQTDIWDRGNYINENTDGEEQVSDIVDALLAELREMEGE